MSGSGKKSICDQHKETKKNPKNLRWKELAFFAIAIEVYFTLKPYTR